MPVTSMAPACLRLGRRRAQLGPVSRGGSVAGQAGVDLEVHPGPALRRRRRRGQPGDLVERLSRHVDLGRDQRGQVLLDPVEPGQHRPRVPGLAYGQAPRPGWPRPANPPPRRRASRRAADHPVAVPVRLDDHHQPGRPDAVLERGDIGPEGGQVDVGAGRAGIDARRRGDVHLVGPHRSARSARRCWSRPTVRPMAGASSCGGITPGWAAAARACTEAPSWPASSAPFPAASRAAQTPPRTSPEPA